MTDLAESALALLQGMIDQQRDKLAKLARAIDPKLTAEDLLQPHDRPELFGDPLFNYEDGILAGLISAQTALRAARRQSSPPPEAAAPGG
ncbi:MAG TPA: hypothetical protein VGB99_12855 [Acidobacteriota bacterium]